ncbi:MAG: cation transporter [Frankiales bacterium]|nr:cation transporter [Frankiales bacterium]
MSTHTHAEHARGGAGGHVHVSAGSSAQADRRWLAGALALILAFMAGEIVVGLLTGSLALLADAGHMLTDAAALALAIAASKVAQRPARGSFTYGFTRIDAISAQANGITLLLLALWFGIQAIRRLFSPEQVHGGPVVVVALVGVLVNVLAVWLASRADRASLNVRGALAHIVNDLWAFLATAIAGVVILITDWSRADAVASLIIAALMTYSGAGLVRASGRVFLEAAPEGVDPKEIGAAMAAVPGVTEIHDLHVWDLGSAEPALSAHIVVSPAYDCHHVAAQVRQVLVADYAISHATLQADHRHLGQPPEEADCPAISHGPGYSGLDRAAQASTDSPV